MKKTYAVVIEKAQGNYSAYVPDLPGCVSTGRTLNEVERSIREAIEFHLEGMREVGEPIPEPTSIAREIEVIQPAA
jgi:predicted RNase H-like HicB family nuclease